MKPTNSFKPPGFPRGAGDSPGYINPESVNEVIGFAPAVASSAADWGSYGQDVVDVVPGYDGRYDLASIGNQEYQKTPFAFGDVGTGASIGTAIAPGIGTAIGAGVGLASAAGKQVFQGIKKAQFEREQRRKMMSASYKNNIIDRREMVLDNMGTRFSRGYQRFNGR